MKIFVADYDRLDAADKPRHVGGGGNCQNVLGSIAKQFGILFLLDATQSIGQMPVDVKEIKCDFLCATGRKFLRGPRGTGFLYVSKNVIPGCTPPFIDMHSATLIKIDHYELQNNASRFETWEQNIAAKLGLKTAIQYSLDLGSSEIWERILCLAKLLRQHLAEIDGVKIQDLGLNKCGISFTCKNRSPKELKKYLATKKINISVSLQEYAPLDLVQRKINDLVRASLHYYNTEEEIVLFCGSTNSRPSRNWRSEHYHILNHELFLRGLPSTTLIFKIYFQPK